MKGLLKMELLLLFIIYFIFFLLFYKIYYMIKMRKKKNNKSLLTTTTELIYLTTKYKLNIKKIGINKIINVICLTNALIFSLVLIATFFITNLFIRIVIMFILLMPLIFFIYHFIGCFYRRKGMTIDV